MVLSSVLIGGHGKVAGTGWDEEEEEEEDEGISMY